MLAMTPKNIRWVGTGSAVLIALTAAGAAQANKKAATQGTSQVHAVKVRSDSLTELVASMPEFATEGETVEADRAVASTRGKITGSEHLMSDELKEFRKQLLAAKDAETLEKLLVKYDAEYEAQPNDLKYVIARLTPLIPMRGVFWRMATLAHRAVVTQEALLSQVRSFSEQVMLYEPNSQWTAYMAYMAVPSSALLAKPASKGDEAELRAIGVERKDRRFYVENDMADFLATELYPAYKRAVNRFAKLEPFVIKNGKKAPIVFDNTLRFGPDSLNEGFSSRDRFAFVGRAELYAIAARYHRRMATIAQIAAYNINGNVELRKSLGMKFGIDLKISSNADGDALDIDGVTRQERVEHARRFPKLFTLRDGEWMKKSYFHLHKWADYNSKAWAIIRKDRSNYDMMLDPELFAGRDEQIDQAVANLAMIFPSPEKAKTVTITGAISGDQTDVNLKAMFWDPPKDLKKLMPIKFAKHEDVEGLKKVYPTLSPSDKSQVQMTIDYQENGAKASQKVQWRNYLYGRAIGWDPVEYVKLYPKVGGSPESVANAHRILRETRGGGAIVNTLAIFIK